MQPVESVIFPGSSPGCEVTTAHKLPETGENAEPRSDELFYIMRIYNEHLTEEKQSSLRGEYHAVNRWLLSTLTKWAGEDGI